MIWAGLTTVRDLDCNTIVGESPNVAAMAQAGWAPWPHGPPDLSVGVR
jgi:hypothetical protein